jgi:hypothetical protein
MNCDGLVGSEYREPQENMLMKESSLSPLPTINSRTLEEEN